MAPFSKLTYIPTYIPIVDVISLVTFDSVDLEREKALMGYQLRQ